MNPALFDAISHPRHNARRSTTIRHSSFGMGGLGMKLVTIRTANGTRAGRLEGDTVVELPGRDVGAILAGGGRVCKRPARRMARATPTPMSISRR
jgi:hypothetical protein